MSSPARFFLLIADRSRDDPDVRELGADPERAMAALHEAELEHCESDAQVVLLRSDSLATIRKTHSSYWSGGQERVANILRGNGDRR